RGPSEGGSRSTHKTYDVLCDESTGMCHRAQPAGSLDLSGGRFGFGARIGSGRLARSTSAVGGADLDAQFGGGGRAFLGGERIDDLVDERLQEQLAQLA